jgi:hypothetical protein
MHAGPFHRTSGTIIFRCQANKVSGVTIVAISGEDRPPQRFDVTG